MVALVCLGMGLDMNIRVGMIVRKKTGTAPIHINAICGDQVSGYYVKNGVHVLCNVNELANFNKGKEETVMLKSLPNPMYIGEYHTRTYGEHVNEWDVIL